MSLEPFVPPRRGLLNIVWADACRALGAELVAVVRMGVPDGEDRWFRIVGEVPEYIANGRQRSLAVVCDLDNVGAVAAMCVAGITDEANYSIRCVPRPEIQSEIAS